LAREVSWETGFPVVELLSRPHPGHVQASLDKHQRQNALHQVFQWAEQPGRLPGPVIIVDDVVTTGATLETCAKILSERGYGPIWGLTFTGGSGFGVKKNNLD